MPTLQVFFAIYSDGSRPNDGFSVPEGTDVFLGEMTQVTAPGPGDELFGPHATFFTRYKPKKGFLLALSRDVRGRADDFFADARRVLLEVTAGIDGWAVDVLRLWPFPLATAAEELPDELLAEDLFAVGFTEMGEHGFRAETYGLAKLGQREITFAFRGRDLLEEAALMCGHLADWVLEHGKRVGHGHSMSFGFDRISFFAVEGDAGGPFRGWHPPAIQRLLPGSLFPGVGVLEVQSTPEGHGERQDMTVPLQRALGQRLVLEEQDLTGDSPHHTQTAEVAGQVTALRSLLAWREEPLASKDSGWRFRVRESGDRLAEEGTMKLGDIARKCPELIRWLALPPGVRLEWDALGHLTVDTSKARTEDELAENDEDDELS